MLHINSVLRPKPDCKTLFEGFVRLLGIDEKDAVLIRLDNTFREIPELDFLNNRLSIRVPFTVPVSELRAAILKGDVLVNQVFNTGIPTSIEQLSKAAQTRLEENVRIIQPLAEDERLLFNPTLRESALKRRANECDISFRSVRRLYYRYLWGGQVKNALIPFFHKRGGAGSCQKENTGRRGRKSNKDKKSEIRLPDVRVYLEKGAKLFYLSGQYTMFEAYILTLKKYFSVGASMANGKLEEILVDAVKQPTFRQFRYVCNELESKFGKRIKLPRRSRAEEPAFLFRGRARQELQGPGHRFEIDATKLQVQLVSRYGRANLVGTPTLYLVMDVWSGACVGYALSLENPSWALAAKALHNSFQEKTGVFDRLKLPYTSEDWPCHHLCSKLAADRGELVGNKAGLIPELGIKLEIMPSMCPQLKGKVEAAIKDIKHGGFYHIPGKYPKNPRRRERNGKETAALTLDELERLIVHIIMDYNNDPVPIEHIPHEMLREEKPIVSHMGLYIWGLEHRPGLTRVLSAKEVYTNLLNKGEASVTSRGICFKGQTYTCERLHTGGYLAKAAMQGHYKTEIRYDEHISDRVWFLDYIDDQWVTALNDNEEIRRLQCAFFEIESFQKDARSEREAAKAENIHRKDEKNKLISPETKKAEAEAKAARRGRAKTQNKARIRLHKAVERDANRLKDAERITSLYVDDSAASARNKKTARALTHEAHSQQKKSENSISKLSKELWNSNDNID